MGPFIYSNSGHTAYGVKEYICDTNTDVDLLPLDDTPGSSVLVIDSGDLYILNSKHRLYYENIVLFLFYLFYK
jgi:hypothetical protein